MVVGIAAGVDFLAFFFVCVFWDLLINFFILGEGWAKLNYPPPPGIQMKGYYVKLPVWLVVMVEICN